MAEGDLAALRRKIRAQLGVLGVAQRGVRGVGHRKGVDHQKNLNDQKDRTESETTSKQYGKDSVLLTDSDHQEEISTFRSPFIQTLSHVCDQLLTNPSSPSTTSDWYTSIHLFLTELLHDDDGLKTIRKICRRYVDRLEGLVGFQLTLMGGPTGLHGHFLSMNIDAITLRPVRIPRRRVGVVEDEDEIIADTTTAVNDAATVTAAAATTANTPTSPSSTTTTTTTTPITTAPEVYNLAHMTAEGLLRLSSGIHEELHHSLWMYLLMGSRHFVGKYYTQHTTHTPS